MTEHTTLVRVDSTHPDFISLVLRLDADLAIRDGEGEQHVADLDLKVVTKRAPDFSTEAYLATLHYKREADRAHHRAALLKAGLAP